MHVLHLGVIAATSTVISVDFKIMDRQKLLLYIAIGVGALIIIGLTVWLFVLSRGPATNSNSNYPQSVQNAIDNPVQRNEGWNTLVDNDDYQISYSKSGSSESFFITIVNGPALAVSQKAEQELLSKLQITQEQACNLPVSMNVVNSVDSNLSGYTFGLSFCPDKLHIADAQNP